VSADLNFTAMPSITPNPFREYSNMHELPSCTRRAHSLCKNLIVECECCMQVHAQEQSNL